jgi:hypothetical protein
MSDIGVRQTWTMVLETEELRLVLKALGGRLKPEEIEAARALGDRMSIQRASATKSALAHADRLLADVAGATRARNGDQDAD